jgi:hypothetical protein
VELRSDIESKDFQICKASTPWKSNKPKKLAKVLGGEEQFEGYGKPEEHERNSDL